MEFNFPLISYFKNDITKIGPRLIPDGFFGDRREVQECVTRINLIVTVLGENSAKAQGLQKVITSGERLRNSDHFVYILVDHSAGSRGNGAVVGMLKTGVKHLYLFDSSGNNHEVSANCILDFYVHESKQRTGLGKRIFEYMLQEENVEPRHLAIDKPSPKFLSFLHKHYGLETIIPQMNNFVLFDGFFDSRKDGKNNGPRGRVAAAAGICSTITRSSLSNGLGSFSVAEPPAVLSPKPASPSLATPPPTPFGRPAAHRPVSTMGLILQHQPTTSGRPSPSASPREPLIEQEPEAPAEEETEPESIIEEIEQLSVDAEPQSEIEEAAEEDTNEIPMPIPDPEPLPCKVQAGGVPHLDLKFYHSSLW